MKLITLAEYVEKSKAELDAMKKHWEEEHLKNPKDWPMEMFEGEWGEQELAERFGEI